MFPYIKTSISQRFLTSFVFSMLTMVVLMVHVGFHQTFSVTRLSVALLFLVILQLARNPTIIFFRELTFYLIFLCYMSLSLIWSDNITAQIAAYTMNPSLNFVLIFFLYSGLITYHDERAVFAGSLV